MIKINLVPAKEKKKRDELYAILWAALFLIVVLAGMGYFYVTLLGQAAEVQKEITKVDEESKLYADKIAAVNELKAKKDSLDNLKKTVSAITETQRKEGVIVDQLALNLPLGIWLSGITQGKDKDAAKFTVMGYAFSAKDLKDYFEALRKPNGLLSEVALDIKNVAVAMGTNSKIQQFQITAKVMDPAP